MRTPVAWLIDLLDRPIAFIVDLNIDTVERILLMLQTIVAVVVIVCSSQIIATPPPLFNGFVLLLPPFCWSALIGMGNIIQLAARATGSWHWRMIGAFWELAVCSALCGPLYLRTPLLALVLFFFGVLLQAVLAALIVREIRHEKVRLAIKQHLINEHLSGK